MSNVQENLYDVVVIGGGPAGLTAAIYLARACYRVIVVEKEKFGGQITITNEVVNYPGHEKISGSELTEKMRKQAESFGAEFMLAEVKSLDMNGDIKKVQTSRGELQTFGVLLATGAHPRMIGFEGEKDYRGHGVAYCATCDGEFFTGKEVFVIGGGFAAAEESVFLTKYAKHVTLLMITDDFTCAKATADETKANQNITIHYNTKVDRVEGDSLLRSITYTNTVTGKTNTFSPENGDTFGVFVFAGYEPSTELVRGMAELDQFGYIVTDRQQKTTLEGLYAAGDVCIKNLRQVVTATGEGALAATELEKYVSAMHKKTGLATIAPVKRAENHQAPDTGKSEETSGLFDENMKAQLNTVFKRMQKNLVLKLYLDEREISKELVHYMEELSSMTDKLTCEIVKDGTSDQAELPCVKVAYDDGTLTGMAFHGVPGGHEFTSFILGLYNHSSDGQSIGEDVKQKIKAIAEPKHIRIMVSLTCTMCPDLVVAAQRIASLNPNVKTDVYDLNHFSSLKDKYNVMSVPCYVVNDDKVYFGKKDIEQLLEVLA